LKRREAAVGRYAKLCITAKNSQLKRGNKRLDNHLKPPVVTPATPDKLKRSENLFRVLAIVISFASV
jgi:hypothetical protein